MNQPRNKYGIRVYRSGKPPRTYWYPSAVARDDVWTGFLKRTDVTHLEAVGRR